MSTALDPQATLRDLGRGLIVRRATAEDSEAIVALNSAAFNPGAGEFVRRVLSGQAPVGGGLDTYLVGVDTATGAVVSSLCLLQQAVTYGGVPFTAGQPEMVVTAPAYRNRGLVRAMIGIVHEWSAARGDLMQVIQGIPHYYRQYGYEYAIAHHVSRRAALDDVGDLPATTPFTIREATADDAEFIAGALRHEQRDLIVAREYDADLMRAILSQPPAQTDRHTKIVEQDGRAIGSFDYETQFWAQQRALMHVALLPGYSWYSVFPAVLATLARLPREFSAPEGTVAITHLSAQLGAEHPIYHQRLFVSVAPRLPDAWYVRIPDYAALLRHVRPVLDARLAASALAGHTMELRISFYRSGLRIAVEGGRIQAIEAWQPNYGAGSPFSPLPADESNAAFPGLSFTQLILGYRALDELEYMYVDCRHEGDDVAALLTALFPKGHSRL